MDQYWDKILQSVSDEFFIIEDRSYTVFNVLRHNTSSDSASFTKESIPKASLCQWAQDVGNEKATGSHAVVLRCLLVSTHDKNDYPVDISRDDLSSVARSFGIASAQIPLLFAPFTGCATLDREVCWYFGRPGLRALAHTDAKSGCTNAIVTVEESAQIEFEEDISQLSSFAGHPLMLAFAIRANTLAVSERLFRTYIGSLRQVENLTGFGNDYDEDSGIEQPSMSTPPPPVVDLARLSKKVGSDASNLGNFKIILNKLEPVRKMLLGDGHSTKWAIHFDGQLKREYGKLTGDMLEMDSILEFTREGLLEAITEYQNRARSLQSVIFNLIAKSDADASMALARESGLIATESRAIAQATRKDGNSMKTIAIMTMVFLPGTFYSSLFAIPTLQWGQSPVIQRDFWVYWAFTIPSTILVLVAWLIWNQIGFNEELEAQGSERRSGKWWTRYLSHATKSMAQRDKKVTLSPEHADSMDMRSQHQGQIHIPPEPSSQTKHRRNVLDRGPGKEDETLQV